MQTLHAPRAGNDCFTKFERRESDCRLNSPVTLIAVRPSLVMISAWERPSSPRLHTGGDHASQQVA
jgi:hypothetical protein